MKRLALAAASAAVAGLAACSNAAHPAAAPASPSSSSAAAAGPASTGATSPGSSKPSAAGSNPSAAMHAAAAATCRARYNAWRQGPGQGLFVTLNAVGSAETARNSQALTAALKQAAPAVAKAARYPLPSCADPKGYWEVLLMHVSAGAASKGSASSLQAAMQSMPAITSELTAELKRTAG